MLMRDMSFRLWKKHFGLFLDLKGIWRCGGRLFNADIPFSTKYPVMLLKSHQLSTLIAKSAHEGVLHNRVKETLTEFRSKYWVVKGRSLNRSIIHKCVICRRFDGTHYHPPPSPPLLIFKVKEEPPFTYTEVDLLSHFTSRQAVWRSAARPGSAFTHVVW